MKATEDERKRSPTRRRLFGPVDHNQNKVDASLIWTNINPGFPRVDYSPRFRPRPEDRDRCTDGGRGVEMEGDVETEGDVQTGSIAEAKVHGKGESDQTWSTEGLVLSAGDLDASLNPASSWSQNLGWVRTNKATSNLRSSSGSPASSTGSSDRSSGRRRRTVSVHHSTSNCAEETDQTGSSYSPTSLDPSSRSRPATCAWRTLARVDRSCSEEGRMRSASLGQVSRPIYARYRRSCRNSTAVVAEGTLNFDPTLEPAYKKVPVVQLHGGDISTVLCPPGQNCFFKPIGEGEESPALTVSQSTEEGGDDGSSGGARGSIVDSRLQETETSAENEATSDDVCGLEQDVRGIDGLGVDPSCLGPEAAEDEQCPVSRLQSQRRRRQSNDKMEESLGGEEEPNGHGCIEKDSEVRADDGRRDMSGRRIKDKLVAKPPRAKRRKSHKDGNSNSPS